MLCMLKSGFVWYIDVRTHRARFDILLAKHMIIGSKEKNDQERPGNKGGSSACAPGTWPICLEFFEGLILNWKFWLQNTHRHYCNQRAMFTMCILLFTLTRKTKGIYKGASKLSLDLKIYTALGPRPPDLKFLDPPLEMGSKILVYKHLWVQWQYCSNPWKHNELKRSSMGFRRFRNFN